MAFYFYEYYIPLYFYLWKKIMNLFQHTMTFKNGPFHEERNGLVINSLK